MKMTRSQHTTTLSLDDNGKHGARAVARDTMRNFAVRTGLASTANEDSSPLTRRYLWTDAFAVSNFFQLSRHFPQEEHWYRQTALHLIESVHSGLGKFRTDDAERVGKWLSGASEHHPTAGGLRIGKPLNEKLLGEAYDSDTEWDKDGQYFHYLTKWMMALDLATRRTGDTKYTIWALELMTVAAEKFVHRDYGRPQMYWKMSIDLTRPQILSQGATDPIDGYIVICRLLSTCDKYHILVPDLPKLFEAKGIFLSMVYISPLDDPLGLGGMLLDIYQLEELHQVVGPDHHQKRLLRQLYQASMQGLEYFTKSGQLASPAHERLGFRELGLAIGLHAIERLLSKDQALQLKPFLGLANEIRSFWRNPANQAAISWTNHLDLNEVMLATSLDPDSWLWFSED